MSLSLGIAHIDRPHLRLHLTLLLWPQLLEIVHHARNRLLIWRYALLEHIKSTRDNVKLTDDLLESLSKLFTAATYSSILSTSISACILLKFSDSSTHLWSLCWELRPSWWSSSLRLLHSRCELCSWWFPISGSLPLLSNWWHTSGLLWSITWLGSKVFNEFLLIFVKIALPNHNYRVGTASSEVITTWWESSWSRSTFMTIESVEDVALPQIPYLQSWVIATRKQISTIWMEINLIYFWAMRIIMLYQSLASNIPNFNGLVLTATGDASTVGMELYGVNASVVIDKGFDFLPWGKVIKLNSGVVGPRCNKSCVRCESTSSNPIIVRSNRK